MAYIVKKKTKSGTYLYKIEAIWNKDKQQPRQKAIYLGKERADGTHAPVRPKPVPASPASDAPRRVLDFGALTACRHLARTHGITAALEEVFEPDTAETIFLLAVFLICEELPLFQFETWVGGVPHRFTGKPSAWSSTALSGLLHELGRDAGARQTYQQSIVSLHRQADSRLLIDGTSVSTYGGLDDWAAYGHNRDGEHLPQINIQFAVMEPGTIPVALRMVEGSVPDVSTLLNTLEEMKAFGITGVRATLDRGFFSEANLDRLAQAGCGVIAPVPSRFKLFKQTLQAHAKTIRHAAHAFTAGRDIMFGQRHAVTVAQRPYDAHLYFNGTRRAEEERRFYQTVEKAEAAFAQAPPKTKRAALAKLAGLLPHGLARLLDAVAGEDGTWHPRRRAGAIARHLNTLGYMLVLTDEPQRASRDVLDDYRTRDAVEKLIDNFKNALNDDRIRVHSSETVEGKLFLLLVALHLHSIIQAKLAPSREQSGRRITPREAMLELRRIKSVSYATGAVLISEVAKRQRATLELLGVPAEIFASVQS